MVACGNHESDGFTVEPSSSSEAFASVNFVNKSSFDVDIYRNFNPLNPDSNAIICFVPSGQSKKISIGKSLDDKVGDNFFIRYKVLLANRYDTGSEDIYVDAERTMANITFVVEAGKFYSKEIPQPEASELRFANGYIRARNTGNIAFKMVKGYDVLERLGDKSLNVLSNEFGYFEFYIPFNEDSLSISQLKVDRIDYMEIDDFYIERGKLYSFDISDTAIDGPVITNINPLNR
jgi:hypothetical protein